MALAVLVVAGLQAVSVWRFDHPRVDESEVVHFAVDMLGGDLDPGWYGYGTLNMYMLLLVYRVAYGLQRAMGLVTDMEDFARALFRGGLFFQIGRYVYAVYGVATVAVLGRAASRAGVQTRWIALYALYAVTAADAVYHANYIRVDTLLGLMAAGLVLVSARPTVDRRVLMMAGALAAACISVKLSGALLLTVPAVLAIIGLRRRSVSARDVALAALVSIAIGLLITPFANPVAAMLDIYSTRIASDPFRFGTEFFPGPADRLTRIVGVLRDSVGLPAMIAAAAAVITTGAVRRLAAATIGVLLLLALPFTVSADLPHYWFIPIVTLTRFLALLGAVGVAHRVVAILACRLPSLPDRATRYAPAAAAVAALGLVAVQVNALIPSYRDAAKEPNIVAATRWIEEHRTDAIPIRLNGPYLQYLPEVYDPTETAQSKRISRAFIFDRSGKAFLNRVFIGWLADEYAPATDRVPTAFHTLTAVHLSIAEASLTDTTFSLSACGDSGCDPVAGTGPQSGDRDGSYVIAAGETAVLVEGVSYPADASVELRVTIAGDAQPVVMRYGTIEGPDDAGRLIMRGHGPLRYPIWIPQQRDLIEELNLTEAARAYDDVNDLVDRVTWIVSTPDIYNRFIDIDPSTVPEGLRERSERLRSLYRDLVAQPVVADFRGGSGHGLIIYEVAPE